MKYWEILRKFPQISSNSSGFIISRELKLRFRCPQTTSVSASDGQIDPRNANFPLRNPQFKKSNILGHCSGPEWRFEPELQSAIPPGGGRSTGELAGRQPGSARATPGIWKDITKYEEIWKYKLMFRNMEKYWENPCKFLQNPQNLLYQGNSSCASMSPNNIC